MGYKKTGQKQSLRGNQFSVGKEPLSPIFPGQVIRLRREMLKMKASDLARTSKLNPRTLDAIEKGRIKNPSLSSLYMLTEALGISMASLFSENRSEEKTIFQVGTQKGLHSLEFPQKGFRIVSYTPLVPDVFVGKVILGGDIRIGRDSLPTSGMIFAQPILGKLSLNFDGVDYVIKEGTYAFFDGRFPHSYYNPHPKENSFLLVTCPSFLARN